MKLRPGIVVALAVLVLAVVLLVRPAGLAGVTATRAG